jgi:hypothetical protein
LDSALAISHCRILATHYAARSRMKSKSPLSAGCFRSSARFLQSRESASRKSGSKLEAYEFRTKSAESGGRETNRQERTNFGRRRHVAVGRFAREARGYWRFQRAKTQQRMLVAAGLAEEGNCIPTFSQKYAAALLGDAQLSKNIRCRFRSRPQQPLASMTPTEFAEMVDNLLPSETT